MEKSKTLLLLVVGLLACGLLAVGCGDDEEEATTDAPAVEAPAEEGSSEDLEATEEDSSSEDASSSEVDSEGVYTACVDAIEGTPAEEAAMPSCEQARDAFEQCASAAASAPEAQLESSIKICQDAADQAIQSLEAAKGY